MFYLGSTQWLCALVLVLTFCRLVSAQSSDEEEGRGSSNDPVDIYKHPKSIFSCVGKRSGEYYADPQTQCRLYFVCLPNAQLTLSPTSFACPNTTRFNQATRVCSPEDQVYCQIATRYYENVHGLFKILFFLSFLKFSLKKVPKKYLFFVLGPH